MALYISDSKILLNIAAKFWYIENLYVLLHRETSVAACVADDFR